MENLEEILATTTTDFHTCTSAIELNDFHVLRIAKPKLDQDITILRELYHIVQNENQQAILKFSIDRLQQLSQDCDKILLQKDEDLFSGVLLQDISIETVMELRKTGIAWSKIATLLGISRRTMYNRRQAFEMKEPNDSLSDEELHTAIHRIHETCPTSGAVYVKGALLATGIRAPLKKVKFFLRHVDPYGTMLRKRLRIRRRQYKVKGANSYWHIDTNHKGISYRMVLHGAVDGHSRKIIYLKLSTNNRADTALKFFNEGVSIHGLPKRVRGDKGVENSYIKLLMLSHLPNSFIEGRSVHNTRIERLWREVNLEVWSTFKDIFSFLKEHELLDEHSELDLLCLLYVYVPRIQQRLDQFTLQWNNHGLSSAQNKTPSQMWLVSMLQQEAENGVSGEESGAENRDDFEERVLDPQDSGFETDEFEEGDFDNHNDAILVPDSNLENTDELQAIFLQLVPDPCIDDGNYGIDHYVLLRNSVS
ncbi:uncharacterized protein [Bemisia tabaci]